MSSRRLPREIKNSASKRPYVKVTSKKYLVEVLLNLFPQQYGCSKLPALWPVSCAEFGEGVCKVQGCWAGCAGVVTAESMDVGNLAWTAVRKSTEPGSSGRPPQGD